MVSGDGPMKVMPAAAQASAKSGLLRQQAVARMDGVGAGLLRATRMISGIDR